MRHTCRPRTSSSERCSSWSTQPPPRPGCLPSGAGLGVPSPAVLRLRWLCSGDSGLRPPAFVVRGAGDLGVWSGADDCADLGLLVALDDRLRGPAAFLAP